MIAVLSSVSQYRKSDSGRRNYSADKDPARPKKARRSIPVFYHRCLSATGRAGSRFY